jgi:hypothetical protein
MKYGGYYLVFFVFIGFLLIILYYNNIQQQQQQQQYQLINSNNINGHYGDHSDPSIKYNKYNVDDDHIKLYKDQSNYKKINNINNYTYNIDNIDILKDNININNDSKLGNNNTSLYEPELEEVYNSTLRGNINDIKNEPDEIFNYSIKPNKTDLPIVNPPLQLLKSNAPLRLSEKHLSYD